ncbi:MAG: PAS domain S-box protein [Ignavibacteriae bacterium]|nr:MAG: PAS domain S-box protein [Ignavibacteriota bacterium]
MNTINFPEDILVVDDTPSNLSVLVDFIHEAGYPVRSANSGKLALQHIQTQLPALIILDIMMADMDGYEVCRILKADEKTKPIPIIFISALGDELKRVKGFQVGGVDYITKPFFPDEVLARVKAHLNIRRMQQDLEMSNAALQAEIKVRNRMEVKLRESEEKFRVIFENNSAAIAIIDLDTTITIVNDAFCQMIGYTKEEVVGMSWTKLIVPEDLERITEHNQRLMSEPQATHEKNEVRLIRKNGELGYTMMSVSIVLNEQKYIASFIDITKRKHAEADREKLIGELQQAIVEVKTLRGLIPICSSCKKIRDDKGYWNILESYLVKHSDAQFTHGICPDCMAKLYPGLINAKTDDDVKHEG